MHPQRATANFTRPADTTAYASGDLVANNTTAGSVSPLRFTHTSSAGWLRRVTINHSAANATNSAFRLWLFSEAPTMNAGDNGAFAMATPAPDTLIGSVDVTVDQLYGDTIGYAFVSPGLVIPATCYGLLEARGAYTPASEEVFTVALDIEAGGL